MATARQADADVIAAKAAVESARINLAYTKVTSPISGRIGKSSVTEGALVTNGQADAMATVQQLDPIYVDVTESSNDFMRLKQESLQHGSDTKSVQLIMENGKPYALQGTLQFSDVTVDEAPALLRFAPSSPTHSTLCCQGCLFAPALMRAFHRMPFSFLSRGVTRTPRGDASVMLVNDKTRWKHEPSQPHRRLAISG